MRKVTSGLFISLDGVVESPDQWQFDLFDADMGAAMAEFLDTVDTVLLGRVTYEQWASYWPTSTDEPYASHINNTPKYVFSTTLDKVEWQNSTLVKLPLAEQIKRLKEQPGKNVSTAGSPTLVRSLLENDLLDELVLMIHPVIVGKGKRFFPVQGDLKRLKLVKSQTTGSGITILTFQPLNA